MKRDFDLVRRIMTDIEDMPAGESYQDITYPDEYDQHTIYEHIGLLIDEDLIKGVVHKSFGIVDAFNITGLTWSGHDFIGAAKDDSVWNKAKETIVKHTVSITFSLLLELLKQEARKKLGLS